MLLERENAPDIAAPTIARLRTALKRLRSVGKTTFASLSDDHGNYIQVAGGGVGCVVERRDELAARQFRAYLVSPRVPFENGTTLSYSGGRVSLQRDEWLSIDQAIELFTAFLLATDFPASVAWRDISHLLIHIDQS